MKFVGEAFRNENRLFVGEGGFDRDFRIVRHRFPKSAQANMWMGVRSIVFKIDRVVMNSTASSMSLSDA
jgi:hypothetical protein